MGWVVGYCVCRNEGEEKGSVEVAGYIWWWWWCHVNTSLLLRFFHFCPHVREPRFPRSMLIKIFCFSFFAFSSFILD
jgi:hypothetical protein